MVEQTSPYKIIALSGSLRAASTNTGIIRAAQELTPSTLTIETFDYSSVPIYSGDVEAKGIPDTVLALAEKISAADGVYITCPEHNYSIPAALKNIIDWLSRVQPQPLVKKPIALASAAAGNAGGARAQYDLRKVLVFCDSLVMNKNEVFIGANYTKFEMGTGNLLDEASKKLVGDQLVAFQKWIDQTKRGFTA